MSEPAERAVELIPPSSEIQAKLASITKEAGLLRGLLKLALKAESTDETPAEEVAE